MKKSCRARCKTSRRASCKTSRRTRCKTSRRTRCKTSRRSKNIKKLGKSRKLKKRKVFFGGIVFNSKKFNDLPKYISPEKYKTLNVDEQKFYEIGTYYKNENNDYDYISTEKYNLLKKKEEKDRYDEGNEVIFYKKKETSYDTRTKAVQSDLANQKELEKRQAIIEKEEGAVEMNFEDTDLSSYQQYANEQHGTNIQYRKPVIDEYGLNFDEKYLDAVSEQDDDEKKLYKIEIMTALFGADKNNWNEKYLPVSIVPTEIPPPNSPSAKYNLTYRINATGERNHPNKPMVQTFFNYYQNDGKYEYDREPVIDKGSNFDAAYLDAVDALKDQNQKGFPPPNKHFDILNYFEVIFYEKLIMTKIFGTDEKTWDLKYLPKSIVNTDNEQTPVVFTPKLLDHIMNKTPIIVTGFAPGFALGSGFASRYTTDYA